MRILFILFFFFFVVIYRSITYTSRQIMSRPIGEHNRFVAYLKRSFLDKLKKKKTTISFLCVVISNRGHSKFVCRFGLFFFLLSIVSGFDHAPIVRLAFEPSRS
jgi:hypothetical protein